MFRQHCILKTELQIGARLSSPRPLRARSPVENTASEPLPAAAMRAAHHTPLQLTNASLQPEGRAAVQPQPWQNPLLLLGNFWRYQLLFLPTLPQACRGPLPARPTFVSSFGLRDKQLGGLIAPDISLFHLLRNGPHLCFGDHLGELDNESHGPLTARQLGDAKLQVVGSHPLTPTRSPSHGPCFWNLLLQGLPLDAGVALKHLEELATFSRAAPCEAEDTQPALPIFRGCWVSQLHQMPAHRLYQASCFQLFGKNQPGLCHLQVCNVEVPEPPIEMLVGSWLWKPHSHSPLFTRTTSWATVPAAGNTISGAVDNKLPKKTNTNAQASQHQPTLTDWKTQQSRKDAHTSPHVKTFCFTFFRLNSSMPHVANPGW